MPGSVQRPGDAPSREKTPGSVGEMNPSRENEGMAGFTKEDCQAPLYERAMEALRREAEQADYFLGTFLVHSLAGGTGSGLGSRLVESYRDTFGKAYLATASVWPHSSGETPL